MGPTHVKINHANLIHNYNLLKKEIGDSVKVMAMIKANAYGHGIIEVAKTLEKQNVPYIGVAYPEEGIQLRKANIKHIEESLKKQIVMLFVQWMHG